MTFMMKTKKWIHVESIEYKLEGEEYQNWGQNDTYITNIMS